MSEASATEPGASTSLSASASPLENASLRRSSRPDSTTAQSTGRMPDGAVDAPGGGADVRAVGHGTANGPAARRSERSGSDSWAEAVPATTARASAATTPAATMSGRRTRSAIGSRTRRRGGRGRTGGT